MSRRHFLTSLASTAFLGGFGLASKDSFSATANPRLNLAEIDATLKDMEHRAQGRLGVHILDTATGREYGYRANERFMMLSTFKLLASALVLHRADTGKDALERRITYTKADLVDWSPVTEKHVGGPGLTLAELCEATITTSDNTAANLILKSYGGPAALTAYARQLGDAVTRLDRYEPELNDKHADGLHDTSSPRAMLLTMQKVVLGNALTPQSRTRLQQWLLANTTGGKRLKAGIPASWKIGDKTGTNKNSANDIGVIWPPERAPVLVTAYLSESTANSQVRDATIAAVGKLVHDIV